MEKSLKLRWAKKHEGMSVPGCIWEFYIFALNIINSITSIISGVQWYNGPLPLLPLGQPQPVQHKAHLQWEEERPVEVQRPALLWNLRPTQLWGLRPPQV